MTYLFKLAQRIAKIRLPLVVTLLAALGCSKGDKTEFLAPNPSQNTPVLATIRVEPQITSVRVGSELQFTATGYSASGAVLPVTVDWSAAGGIITPDGRYTGVLTGSFVVRATARERAVSDSARVGVWDNTTDLVALVVSPDSAVIEVGDTLSFSAALEMASGAMTGSASVTWSSSGGQVTPDGQFTSATPGLFEVSAVSVNNLQGSAKILVQQHQQTLTGIQLTPAAATVLSGDSVQFAATANYDDGSSGPADVEWQATGGTISAGRFTATSGGGEYLVIARDRNGTLADTAVVTVPTPTLVRLVISPTAPVLVPGAFQQFSAQAQMSDNSFQVVPLTWSATGGTVLADGAFTAGATEGTFRVVVSSLGSSAADTAVVTIAQPTEELARVSVNPSSAIVAKGASRQFTASGTWSGGGSTTPSVTWTATGGTISASGLYTAGNTPGTFSATARATNGRQDTSAIEITAAVLTNLTLSPATASKQPGQTQQYSVSGTWSDGTTLPPAVTYSATGGTITEGGLYTAGSTAGTFSVIAREAGGTRADTSLVTISTPAPTLTGVVLTPTTAVLAPGGIQQFSALGLYSNGSTGSISITWSETGGSINSSGRYTAGSTPGTYRVIARQSGNTRADTSVVTITSPPSVTSVSISPKPVSLQVGTTAQFSASATWSNGSTSVPTIVWTATGGSVNSSGLYTAGATPGTFRVVGTQQGGTKADTSVVTLSAAPAPVPTLVGLVVAPKPTSVPVNTTRQFNVGALWSDGSSAVPAITWTATGGTINSTGLYTAGATPGTYRAIASGGGKADTSVVTVTASSSPTLTTFYIGPDVVTLAPGETQYYLPTVQWSDGSATMPSITWSVTGGTMNAAYNTYTAGNTAGSYTVVASAGGRTDTARVTISTGAATLTSLSVTPKPVTLQTGTTQQFSTSALWSNGGTTPPAVTWSATGGSITSSGMYTAGSTAGTFRAIATGGGKADTAVVTLTAAPAPTVTAFVLSPASVSLLTLGTQQFSTSATWSDGVSRAVSVSYSVTGGGISVGGLFTAGLLGGTFSVIATCSCGMADTSVVSVSLAGPATLSALSISPKPTNVPANTTRQFTPSAQWSDGSTTLPTITWSATGGSINSSGLYTAGGATGSFRAIATGGGKADTSVVTITTPVPASMYFNSSEAGCGTDPSIILCDDFEDGDWYGKNCDQANSSGGLLQTDGWCGTIYNPSGLAAGTSRCGGAGFKSACAATTGVMSAAGNMADHDLASPASELWLRFYIKPLPGYVWGAEKVITINSTSAGNGGISIGGIGAPFEDGGLLACPVYDCNTTGAIFYYRPNMAAALPLNTMAGHWVFVEMHVKLNTPGQKNGVFDLWMNDCGTAGTGCPGTPTLRTHFTTVEWQAPTDNKQMRSIWFENWSNPASSGERYWDQIKVSTAGPIGFMP